jgi:F-type H+-transporting ATPase subunit gamma
MTLFERGVVDAVEVVFAQFKSALATPPTLLRVLPISVARSGEGAPGPGVNYILRPSAAAILEQLLPLYVRNQVYRALVETAAAFLGAQRTAMKNATDNAGEVLDILRRTYNRARQAQITQELAEIVGGAEALKG